MTKCNADCPVPPELLYDILKDVLRDYFHHFILDEEKPNWDAVENLSLVSRLFCDTTCKILAHASKLDVSEDLHNAVKTARVMLDQVRKQANNARNEPELFKEFLMDAASSASSVITTPFFAAYLFYLDGHLATRTLMANFVKDLVEGKYRPAEFPDIVIETMKPLVSAFKHDCNLVIPTGFCDSIGSLIAEEYLLLLAFGRSGVYGRAMTLSVTALVELAKAGPCERQDEIAQCLATTADMLKRIVDGFQFKGPNNAAYLEWVSIPRCTELAREALVAIGLAPFLKTLVELPKILEDSSGVAETARLILETWGEE